MAKKTKSTKSKSVPYIEEKLARICWNTNGWTKPSGAMEKLECGTETFEYKFGFGFEEWLFDVTAKFGEYQYGFLQQFNSRSSLSNFTKKEVENKVLYNIHLFTLSSPQVYNGRKKAFYVGQIKNVEVLTCDEQEKVYHHFLSNGRLMQMYNDVCNAQGDWPRNGIFNTRPEDVFNIRFKMKDFVPAKPITVLDTSYNRKSRYVLMNYKQLKCKIDPETGKPEIADIASLKKISNKTL